MPFVGAACFQYKLFCTSNYWKFCSHFLLMFFTCLLYAAGNFVLFQTFFEFVCMLLESFYAYNDGMLQEIDSLITILSH